ncbi:MAG TPA: sulfite exporter TauE/SafE family protein [Thermomicrobiales bacterium]|nr:sulfite exporter TauE/SafE family protein [Thermomicrobiales bacterium]
MQVEERSDELGELIAVGIVAVVAGTLGTMLGLGGGVFLVPILSLVFGVQLETAVAASAIAVVANSASGSANYLRARFTNVRLAMLMLVATTAGAVIGGVVAIGLPEAALKGLFAGLLLFVAVVMYRRSFLSIASSVAIELPDDPLRLGGRFQDPSVNAIVTYVPRNVRLGMPIASLGGVASGMFGIGGGPITVPLMTVLMQMPVKAAASTSSFMVGLTASASAFIYYANGFVNPRVTVAAVFGIVLGARLGVRVATRVRPQLLVSIFIVMLATLSILMATDAIGLI